MTDKLSRLDLPARKRRTRALVFIPARRSNGRRTCQGKAMIDKPKKPKLIGSRLDVRVRYLIASGILKPGWAVCIEGKEAHRVYDTKADAMLEAFIMCQWLVDVGFDTELTPHNLDGRVSKSGHATYPRSSDPRRHRG